MSQKLYGLTSPGTISGLPDPFTDLPEAASIEDAPALAAIRSGIGAHLEANGYVAEHPLLYVSEAEDPYVYVRFDLSEDGLGFLDATYVYSPGAVDLLDEIFTDYGVYEEEGRKVPYEPESIMLGRPIHARILSLETCELELSARRLEAWETAASDLATVKAGRRGKGLLRRCRVRRAARRRLTARGGLPKFGVRQREEDWPPKKLLSLPLNWDMESPIYQWSNWSVASGLESAAAGSLSIWRAFVEPRLIHASRDRGKGVSLDSLLTFPSEGPGNGIFGEEWLCYDRLYWYMKGDICSDEYYIESRYSRGYIGCAFCLYDEINHMEIELYGKVRELVRAEYLVGGRTPRHLLEQKRQDILAIPQVAQSAAAFRREAAILAFREDVPAVGDWRAKLKKRQVAASKTVENIMASAISDSDKEDNLEYRKYLEGVHDAYFGKR